MLNYILTAVIGVIAIMGSFFPKNTTQIWDEVSQVFGGVSYPTSLDTLTNPGATDSVATVSHSSQHANANDAIEALEAKAGTGASTPIANTVLVGNGTGSSIWTTFATSTQFYATNFFATGSSTLQNFSFVNATGTAATTTNLFSTNASTTNLTGTNINGFGLSSCVGNNYIQWSGGNFSCVAVSAGATVTFYVATSSTGINLAVGPISVVVGDQFNIQGKIGNGSLNNPILLTYRQSNESASTTLDSTNLNQTSVSFWTGSTQGYFIATTTTSVYFSIFSPNPSSSVWSSLIVQKFN